MLILRKVLKSFFLIITLGFFGGWLSHIIHPILYDPVLYPDEGIIFSLIMGLVITFITYYTLIILKKSNNYFKRSSNLKNGVHAVAITLIIFLLICWITFGINMTGLLLYVSSFSLVNFFMPYLNMYFDKIFQL
ncbi:hypothetical protein ACFQ3S_19650 [Mucilaginibacter terrae]|uniref:hypothetical protein n=1 Tax=Mucilaginibacter terrae TaxID=1955052 RepID=UPI0036296FC0